MCDVVILCGGKGSRLSEETTKKPKPMVEIAGRPILWHIMKIYSHYGFKRFILTLGYKGSCIKEYFYNYRAIGSDFSLKLDPSHHVEYHNNSDEKDWEITFIDTGEETLKGGRIRRVAKHIKSDLFHLTYGDGLGDINLSDLLQFHKSHGRIGTLTSVRPPSRFGELKLETDTVLAFEEKPQMGTGIINGGFFVFDKRFLEYLTEDEDCDFEFGALQEIARQGQLKAFEHLGFWQCMDNIRERDYLDRLARSSNAPWVVWR
ncbi:glucose-1-phosphate cytidylyltransferase [Alkalispirochaeta odontotermitis]|nr:glucose-1-phosphate cytidylyltransferase [Alkalispirochaeta odontotermitis]CAB1075337.1 Glucose-1-phosphate cytidylyltransferase (EC [Olavius algarvensis Delta 1 endosymbiont]